jgi:hypothetical protein
MQFSRKSDGNLEYSHNCVGGTLVKLRDVWSDSGKLILLVVAVTIMFLGPRVLTRYLQSEDLYSASSAYDCFEDAEPYLLTRGC